MHGKNGELLVPDFHQAIGQISCLLQRLQGELVFMPIFYHFTDEPKNKNATTLLIIINPATF